MNQQTRERIFAFWKERTAEQRAFSETEPFATVMWDRGIRLAKTEHLHYQHVMDLIRDHTTDGK